MGFEKPITIQTAILEIQSNKYVLPAIQREFVWKPDQIESLFDSLLRGYPIGSFLFWKVTPESLGDFQFYHFMDHYHERDYRHNEPYNPPPNREITAVLDGQQRLTALYIGINGWYSYKLPRFRWNNDDAFPKQKLYINLLRPQIQEEGIEANGFEVRFLKKEDLKKKDPQKHWFKVGDIFNFTKMQDVFNYCVKNGLINDRDTYSSDTLVGLWDVLTQKPMVNYFLEEDQSLDKVLNIFIRVNSGGTPLSYSDMLLSIATAAWKKLDARQEIYNLVEELNQIGDGFNFNKDFILKAGLVLSDILAIEFRASSFNRENMLIIEKNWDKIVHALKNAGYLLASWGYNWQTLVSNFAVIPLAYHLYKLNSPKNFVTSSQYKLSREYMLHWLRVALLKRTFSGPTDNTLRAIRRAMLAEKSEIFPQIAIFDVLKATPKSMSFDEPELEGLLSFRYGQNYIFSVLAMIYPWLKYDQQFHIDHIFPRSRFNTKELKSRKISEDRWHLWLDHVNDLGNLQLLQGQVNQSKSDQHFESWLMGECRTPNDLQSYKELNLIPDVKLKFENFPEFLEARTNLMREKLASILGVKLSVD